MMIKYSNLKQVISMVSTGSWQKNNNSLILRVATGKQE
jgi:hypothetical protein